MMFKLLREEKAQSDWSAVYLILIFAIIAIILISIVKPMFKQSQRIITRTKRGLGD